MERALVYFLTVESESTRIEGKAPWILWPDVNANLGFPDLMWRELKFTLVKGRDHGFTDRMWMLAKDLWTAFILSLAFYCCSNIYSDFYWLLSLNWIYTRADAFSDNCINPYPCNLWKKNLNSIMMMFLQSNHISFRTIIPVTLGAWIPN